MKIFNFQYSTLNLFIIKFIFRKYNIHRFMQFIYSHRNSTEVNFYFKSYFVAFNMINEKNTYKIFLLKTTS